MLATLSLLTGADVAASTDTTGHAFFGGDWELEYATGRVETGLAFSHHVQQNWSHVLAVGVDATSLGQGIGSSVTVSHTTAGANRLMLVGISMGNPAGNSVASVTYNGVALTFVGMHAIGIAPDEARVEVWALVAPSTGTHNVVVNLAGPNAGGTTVGVMTFTGVDQATPLGTFVSDAGNAANGTVNVSSAADELVFGVIAVEAGVSDYELVPGSGQTERWDLFEAEANGGGSTAAGASSVAISWTFDAANQWAIGAVPIHAANTAPTLDASRSPLLNSMNEDAGAPSGAVGTLITSLVDFASPAGQVDNVTDPDTGAQLGIALTAADTTNGAWWYSTNNGGSWNALGAVTSSSARLLAADASTRIYFQPNANFNGTLASAITFRAWDRTSGTNGNTADTSLNGGTTAFSTATDTASLTVNAVNDPPTANAPASYSATEQVSLTLHGTGLSIADVDAASGSVQATLSVVSGTLTVTAGATGVAVLGSGSSSVSLTGTLAQINNLLAGNLGATASYLINSDTPPASDTLTLLINDQGNTGSGGAQSGSDNSTINITAVNDAPTANAPASYSSTEQVSLTLHGTGLSIADVDAASGSVQATLSVVSGTLTVTAGASGVSVLGSGSNSVSLTGTLAQINNLLAGNLGATASYLINSDTPPATDTLTLLINDQGNTGSGGAQSDSANSTINLTAVNDAPTANAPASYSATEQVSLTLHGTGLSIADADAAGGSVQATLSVVSGTLTVTAGASGVAVLGSGSSSVSLTGTVAQINNLLAGNLARRPAI